MTQEKIDNLKEMLNTIKGILSSDKVSIVERSDNTINVRFKNKNSNVLRFTARLQDDIFIIEFITVGSNYRGKGICKLFIDCLHQHQSVRFKIFQVVSERLHSICESSPFCKKTLIADLPRDTVNIKWKHYTEDYGDYIII